MKRDPLGQFCTGPIFPLKWLKWLRIHWWIRLDAKRGDRWRLNRARINLPIIRHCFWPHGHSSRSAILCCSLMTSSMPPLAEYSFVNRDRSIVALLCSSWTLPPGDAVLASPTPFAASGTVEWRSLPCFLHSLLWVPPHSMCPDAASIRNSFCSLFFLRCIACHAKVCVCVCVLVPWIAPWLPSRVRSLVVDVVNVV